MNVGTTTEVISNNAGLEMIIQLLNKTSMSKKLDELGATDSVPSNIRDIIVTYIASMITGSTTFENIRQYKNDEFFCQALGLTKVISPETLRQRIDQIASDKETLNRIEEIIYETTDELLTIIPSKPTSTDETKCTNELNSKYVLVDVDVTVLDNSRTKKEKVSYTYKKCMGYAPLNVYISGDEGYYLYGELRPGSQHCQRDTVESLSKVITRLKKLDLGNYLVRMDSGNDSNDNYALMCENEVDFVIKWNPRKTDTKEFWYDSAVKMDKTVVYYDEKRKVEVIHSEIIDIPGTSKPVKRVYFAIKKEPSLINQLHFDSDSEYELEAYTTSLLDVPEQTIREMYHEHGTSEQFHAELKSELNVERLPSGKFNTNKLVYTLSTLAYNLLRVISQVSLMENDTPMPKHDVIRRRIKTIIFSYIKQATKLVKHSRSVTMLLCVHNPWTKSFIRILEYIKAIPIIQY